MEHHMATMDFLQLDGMAALTRIFPALPATVPQHLAVLSPHNEDLARETLSWRPSFPVHVDHVPAASLQGLLF